MFKLPLTTTQIGNIYLLINWKILNKIKKLKIKRQSDIV